MIKRLLFIAALLAPCLAYGQDPSADLSVQVTPAGSDPIACDIGPALPSVPAPAQKAGFTTCALDADFAQIYGNYTDANGWNFGNTSTFIYECGGHASNNYTYYRILLQSGPSLTTAPCSYATIVTDPVYSNQALHVIYPLSQFNSGYLRTALNWPNSSGASSLPPCRVVSGTFGPYGCAGGPYGNGMVNEGYYEMNWRVTSQDFTNISSGQDLIQDWWLDNSWGDCGTCEKQIDFLELQSSYCTGFSCLMQGGATGATGNTATFSNVTAYTPTGFLITQAGDGNTWYCVYIGQAQINSGVAKGCSEQTGNPTNTNFSKVMSQWVGTADCYGGTPTPPSCLGTTTTMDMYIQYQRVWKCANYWTSQCYGTVVTSDGSDIILRAKSYAKRLRGWADTELASLTDRAREQLAWITGLVVPSAKADPFDPPYDAMWLCSDGKHTGMHEVCEPPELKDKEWWTSCVPNRSDCVESDTAFIGLGPHNALRGHGYCYKEQPYTCSPAGKAPQ